MKRPLIWFLAPLVVGVLVVVIMRLWPVDTPPLQIAKDTTFLLGPVNPDGTINYVEGLNAIYGEGVTPQNNAAVLVLRAMGPRAIGPERVSQAARERVFERLGMEPLPSDGAYLIRLTDFEKSQAADAGKAPTSQTGNQWTSRVAEGFRRGWTAEEERLVAGWLLTNQQAMSLLAEASQRERFYVPFVSPSNPPQIVGCPFLVGLPLWDAGWLHVCRAMLHLRTGDLAGAVEDSLIGHRLARLYAQQPEILIQTLGVGIDSQMSEVDAMIATDPRLTSDLARRLLRQLQSLPAVTPLCQMVNVTQRCEALDAAMLFVRAGEDPLLGLKGRKAKPRVDWNIMLWHMNALYDRMAEAWREPEYARRQFRLEQFSGEVRQTGSSMQRSESLADSLNNLLLTPKALQRKMSIFGGDALLAFTTPSLESACPREAKAIVQQQLATVALALFLHRAEKGAYPASLGDLAPEYLDKVPLDQFTGQLFRYTPGDGVYLLCSLGPNGRDDGAMPYAGQKAGDAYGLVVRAQRAADSQSEANRAPSPAPEP